MKALRHTDPYALYECFLQSDAQSMPVEKHVQTFLPKGLTE